MEVKHSSQRQEGSNDDNRVVARQETTDRSDTGSQSHPLPELFATLGILTFFDILQQRFRVNDSSAMMRDRDLE